MKILDIGCGDAKYARAIIGAPESAEVLTMDANPEVKPDIVHDITRPLPEELHGRFEVVVASHILEHIDRNYVRGVVNEIAKAVKPGGELWIIVPSMEWAADEIRRGHDNMTVQLCIFGGQQNEWDYHRSGFTLQTLRYLIEGAGLIVRQARQTPFSISVGEEILNAVQDIVIGLKMPEG